MTLPNSRYLLSDCFISWYFKPRPFPTTVASYMSALESICLLADSNARLDRMVQVETNTRGTAWGTGGMKTKLTAARIATAAGCNTVICNAAHPGNIQRILEGEPLGTVFHHHPRALKCASYYLPFPHFGTPCNLTLGSVQSCNNCHQQLPPTEVDVIKLESRPHLQRVLSRLSHMMALQ